jgi:aminoglycoside phosphotransferase (APT) family kinase protein
VPSPDADAVPCRAGEELPTEKLEPYLRERLPGAEGPLEVLQFPHGHANLTYLLRFGEREFVLRRPPFGPVAPKSHDMAREYRVLSKLWRHFAPAPHAYLFCDDLSILGAIFVVMERRRGLVIRGSVPPEIDRHPDGRRRASFATIDAIADFHDVDYAKIGLADLGQPDGFVERQVSGWYGRWQRAKDVELPRFDEVHRWLVAHLPAQGRASLVHNDLKFDNVMLDPENPDRVVAFLDWDMTTLGDPLVDLGTLLGYWVESGDRPERGAALAVTAQPGFPKRAEVAGRYARRRNLDVSSLRWYEAFAIWKTAVVIQQIYIRFARGQTDDPRFAGMGSRVALLAEIAAETAGLR